MHSGSGAVVRLSWWTALYGRCPIPDTPQNQAIYPQPSTQALGVGFPLARLVMVICLATGAALDVTIGPHSGKGSGELGLVRHLLEGFGPGDVMLSRVPVLQLLA